MTPGLEAYALSARRWDGWHLSGHVHGSQTGPIAMTVVHIVPRVGSMHTHPKTSCCSPPVMHLGYPELQMPARQK